jgi:hypothetical protein
MFSPVVADSCHFEPRCRERFAGRGALALPSNIALSVERDLTRTYDGNRKGMGAEHCDRSRTLGKGLGACQKLWPRKEAGANIVVCHMNALPGGGWERNADHAPVSVS